MKQTLSLTKTEGVFTYKSSNTRKLFTLKKFEADDIKYKKNQTNFSPNDFWSNGEKTVYYGSDVPSQSVYMKELNDRNIYENIPEAKNQDILGICTPYIYVGKTASFFPLHQEDMDLFSISILHRGQAKIWYTVSPQVTFVKIKYLQIPYSHFTG